METDGSLRLHMGPSPVPFLSQINLLQQPLDFFKTYFNYYYPPICAHVFPVDSFPQVSALKTCVHLSSHPYVPGGPSISFFLIWLIE